MDMPVLETARLVIRPFTRADFEFIHQLLDVELRDAEFGTEGALSREARRAWLEWTVLNYEQLAGMYQPPYGDRAIMLKVSGELVGSCGYVPCLAPFGQLPGFRATTAAGAARNTPEFGLYWAIAPRRQRRGYASEAGRALVAYAFEQLNLQRIVAGTTYDNAASIGVMRRIGMRITHNPLPDPPWLQVMGVLEQPA